MLEIQRAAWKERHDAKAAYAKRPSGEHYEALKRAEEWFEIVAYAKRLPIERPVYASSTHFLETENQALRQELLQVSRRKDSLSSLTQEYIFAVKMKRSDQELQVILDKINALKDLPDLEQYELAQPSKVIGKANLLLKENQLFKSLIPKMDKRRKVGDCVVCLENPAQYYYNRHYLVCSGACAHQISSS
jgi:hypothetical protein